MFLTQIQKLPWQTECDMSNLYRAMTVQIGFSHKENDSDEVEFCINAWDAPELTELFEAFCKENHFKDVSIHSISVVRVAHTLDQLTEMEERESWPEIIKTNQKDNNSLEKQIFGASQNIKEQKDNSSEDKIKHREREESR